MPTFQAIATVVSVVGKAYVRTLDGELHPLQSGDKIHEGEQIVTLENGRVQLDFGNNAGMEIATGQVVTVSNELAEDFWPDENQAALAETTVDRVIEALEQGRDIGDRPDSTASSQGLNTNDGNNFVRLQRIIEEVDPVAFSFPIRSDQTLNDYEGFADGTIQPEPTITSVTSNAQIEGTDLVHTATLSNASAVDTIHSFTLAGNTASASDFGAPVFSNGVTLNAGNITVPAGVTTFTITIPTSPDSMVETNETLNLTIDAQTAVGTIIDEDSTSFAIGDMSISEGGLVTFTVTRTGDAVADQTIDFATSISGTDTAEVDDFTANSATLTFAQGVTSQTFTVQTTQDAIFEGAETFTATLSNNSAGSIITTATATGTILDDGTGPGPFNPGPGANNDATSFAIGDMSISEGGLVTFTVTRTGDAEAAQTIDFATSIEAGDNSELADFSASSGTLTFASGVLSQTFTVQTTQDAIFEGAETFTATLSNNSAGSSITTATATGTILDDGTGPGPFNPGPGANDDSTSFAIGDMSVSEGGLMTFTVTRTGDSEADQTIDFATSISGTDSAELADFFANSGTLTFASGVLSQTFTVQTTQDAVFEGAETFTATLSNNSVGSSITTTTAVGTILDDGTGSAPFNPGPGADDDRPGFSIGDMSISEGGLMTFTVTRAGDAASTQTVDFTTSIAGTDNTEIADFTANSGTLTFATGVVSQTFTVQTAQDAFFEGAETFTATLSNNSVGSSIITATATGTILDDGTGSGPFNPGPGSDDDSTSFTIGDMSISEGGLMTFTVTRSGDAEADQTIDFATSIEAGDNSRTG